MVDDTLESLGSQSQSVVDNMLDETLESEVNTTDDTGGFRRRSKRDMPNFMISPLPVKKKKKK